MSALSIVGVSVPFPELVQFPLLHRSTRVRQYTIVCLYGDLLGARVNVLIWKILVRVFASIQ